MTLDFLAAKGMIKINEGKARARFPQLCSLYACIPDSLYLLLYALIHPELNILLLLVEEEACSLLSMW